MSQGEVDEAELAAILERDILPAYFPSEEASLTPTLVVLAGQPGAGRSRAVHRAIADRRDDLAIINSDDLRALHPRLGELERSRSQEAAQTLARATATWLRGCIRYARENHRSLLLDGSFSDPSVVTATAARFAAEGFRTRVVVVASRRAESLLSVLSLYLRNVQANAPARYVSREAHDRGFDATRALVAELEAAASIDRLTVVSRGGRTAFDADRTEAADTFRGAGAALVAEQAAPMGRFDATQWLSELHHVTGFAASRRDLPRDVTQVLIDLHEASLREVIPELQVPTGGKFATAIEQRTVARLVALRRALKPEPPVDAAAPVVAPSGPERGGVSR